ncbi:toxic anion resistance protein [Ruminococcus sp. HUN007]|uniref:toxic anion resistance protein n=1 Tax=Ruminococcus sp. HUN007 TaxID=1514668 RepID=UPI0005D1D58A|nr:toxic anion resistance protein [Ruminococcus sp. HUN007]
MALNFKPSAEAAKDAATEIIPTAEATPVPEVVPEVEQEFNITVAKTELQEKIINSDEIDRLTAQIDVSNPNSIVKFGGPVAEEISKASDQVLNSMDINQINDSGKLLQNLAEVMNQFDSKELAMEEKGLKKLFSNAKKELDKILGKYHTMGEAVDKIYIQLKGYEKEIGETNVKLDKMFEANLAYYEELLKYIMAGEQGVKELDAYIEEYQAKVNANPEDGTIRMDLNNLIQTRDILDQRVMDLKVAENVALQTIPMLKTMEYSNLNLIRKINSAFIITMPVFKQSLAQAIMLKRQRVQAEAMSALDEKTNELLIKNAENTVAQSKMTAQLASGSSIQVETLEKTWNTIVRGIDETKQIQEQARIKRQEDAKKLEALKDDFKNKMHGAI